MNETPDPVAHDARPGFGYAAGHQIPVPGAAAVTLFGIDPVRPGFLYIAPIGDSRDGPNWVHIGEVEGDGIQTEPEPLRSERLGWLTSPVHAAGTRRDRYVPVPQKTCPCGAQAAPGSGYCGYDCIPNHTSLDSSGGTAARWRPELISLTEDAGLEALGPLGTFHGFRTQVFRQHGTALLHLRLDDGTRFVGADIPDCAPREDPEEFQQRCDRKWTALMVELLNPNSQQSTDLPRRPSRRPDRAETEMTLPEHLDQTFSLLRDSGSYAIRALQDIIACAAGGGLGPAAAGPEAAAEETPQQRALRLRRERNTGPRHRPRAPRRIDPGATR